MIVGSHIKGYLDGLDDSLKLCRNLFVKIKSDLILRNHIPPRVVDWYGNDIIFLVDKDNYFLESMVLRVSWVTPLPYEMFEHECMSLAEKLWKMPKDPNVESLRTKEEILGRY